MKLSYAALAVGLLMSGGCAGHNYAQVAIGQKFNGNWNDGGSPTAHFTIGRRSDDGKRFCQVAHDSNWFAGAPFNNRAETHVDRAECGLEYRF